MFAGYRIERRLGAGGMGAVYLAVNQTLPRLEALKVLSAELSSDPEFRARFVREADVAAALDHPHIVSVYNRGQTDDGQLWIAMQFVDGTNASEALRAETMTPDRAVHIVTQIAAALDYAHSRNVVHRDVKPANFLMSGPVGHAERVFLADFGIARALGDIGLTVTGAIVGTVSYAAPEVLASLPFDGRADIYSLGCALFRLLTGQAPFPGANGLAAVMAAHLSAPRPRITDVMPSLPAALDEVIATAMAKDPAARFDCATALADAATAALSDTTSSEPLPRPPVPSSQVTASLRSQTGPIWVGEERSGVLTGMPTRASPRFARSPKRRRITIAAALAAVAVAASSLLVVEWPRGTSESSAPGHGPSQSEKTTWAAPTLAGPDGGADHAMAPNAMLASVLLTKPELTAAGSEDALDLADDRTQLLNDSATINNLLCLAAWLPAQQAAYAKSNPISAAVQIWQDPRSKQVWKDGVIQAAVQVDRPKDAQQLVRNLQQQWEACASNRIEVAAPPGAPTDPTQYWYFENLVTTAGTLTMKAHLRDGGGYCERGFAARGNVLIDIRQCRSDGKNDVAALVSATADKVPSQ